MKPYLGAISLNSPHIPLFGNIGLIKSILLLFNPKSIASPVWCSEASGRATYLLVNSIPFSFIDVSYISICSSFVL